MDKGVLGHDGGGPGIVSWLYADPAANTVAAVLTNAAHGGPVVDEITAPLYEAAGAKTPGADYGTSRSRPRTRGSTRTPKLLFYDGDTLEQSPPLPLRPIRDSLFTTGRGFVTFLNPGADGRMQHLASRRRLHKRSG
jgi:hypothetical protein